MIVSMPSTGFYLFLHVITNFIKTGNPCVNALNGLLLISSDPEDLEEYVHHIVSMPSTGFYLFLPFNISMVKQTVEVSMPSTGFYLFLPTMGYYSLKGNIKCQCPQRASTYFFKFFLDCYENNYIVSMPSTGFYLFLQKSIIEQPLEQICVNALNGLLLISSTMYIREPET